MVRDDDDVAPELRRRRGEGLESHSVAQRCADAVKDAKAVEAVRRVTPERAEGLPK